MSAKNAVIKKNEYLCGDMKKYSTYVHLLPNWPNLHWDKERVVEMLSNVRYKQGKLLGKMEGLGFSFNSETALNTVLQDVLKSSAIEGERLPMEHPVHAAGVEMMAVDAMHNCTTTTYWWDCPPKLPVSRWVAATRLRLRDCRPGKPCLISAAAAESTAFWQRGKWAKTGMLSG